MNREIFRQYDIRGVVGVDLDDDMVEILGKGIGTLLQNKGETRITLGMDARLSGPAFSEAITRGLISTGIDVIQLGMVTTPIFYFSIHHLMTGGGVMITGSHNPPEFNGFKINTGTDSLYGEGIQDLYRLIEKGYFLSGEGSVKEYNIIPDYIDYMKTAISLDRPLRVALDGGNGTAGLAAPDIFKYHTCVAYNLFMEPDGNFPNHHPDPTIPKNVEELRKVVLEKNLDFGVAFDGDADRIGVVDEKGNIIWGDQLMIIFSRSILRKNPGAAIIGEVKSSQNLYDDIKKNGGEPIMWKTGHSLIKSKMKQEKAL